MNTLQRYAFTIEYNGLSYNGFQIQPVSKAKKTVQGVVENAFEILFPLLKPKIYGSGRTDTGVHASGQVFHVDLPTAKDITVLEKKMNGLLIDEDVVILDVRKTVPDFHARFSAVSREYCYTVNQKRSSLNSHQEWFFPYQIDLETLNKMSKIIEKQNDFTSFCKTADESETKNCDIKFAFWRQEESRFFFHIKARRFLYGMVRALAGTQLSYIKEGWTVEEFEKIFAKKDRKAASFSSKSYGLNLVKVEYPKEMFLEK